MNRYKVIQTKNDCYKKGTPLTPVGVLVHSTGANNPWLKRYVDGIDFFGANVYNNHWNRPGVRKCMHGFIGKDKEGNVAFAQTLPYNIACWGCGAGPKGSYNRNPTGHIQFEICEDDLKNKQYYTETFNAAEELCAEWCIMFGFPASSITSHYEAHDLGYASNHGDPRHWMKLYDDSMDKFRARVNLRIQNKIADLFKEEEEFISDRKIKVRITREENATYYGKKLGDIVEIDFEKYIEGVLASEIGNAPLEACKAQAVAARTFALSRVGGVGGTGAIGDDSSTNQAFRAPRLNSSSYPNCRKAAIATEGQVLFYKGKLVETAVYSDANGGRTYSSEERWGGVRPYLIAQPDIWDLALSKGVKNGHGVGLSQTGAKYAASVGFNYKQILAFYYPNTTLAPKYGTGVVEELPPVGENEEPDETTEDLNNFTGKYVDVHTVKPEGLNIWSTRTKDKSLLKVPRGGVIFVMKDDMSGWVIGKRNNTVGFVDKRYLRVVSDAQQNEAELDPATNEELEPGFTRYSAKVETHYDEGISLWSDTNKSKRLIRAKKGETITVLNEVNAQWAFVEYQAVQGYADRRYLIKV